KYIGTVPPGAFAPAPNVDSAILAISDISRQNFDSEKHEKAFFDLIHAGFAHKRKQIGGNLKLIVSEPEKLLNSVGIEPKTRAEDISLDKWLELARNMVENQQ
ncbi:MAG: 16S rRNA (adenine(1518)-N(6)/adenine(1519)-N(6))-dimethyltransferase, partial [Candidatus Nomurabacteria bacterium]|nr:16S rRNA (adenine(1518)-N(6)/adenine(1519)-N(6))-dimethyltransferase [Candidatus Nomurabacteria bacterium]